MGATNRNDKEKKATNVTQILIALIGVIGSIAVAYITVNAKAGGIAKNATEIQFKIEMENAKSSIGKLSAEIKKLGEKLSDFEEKIRRLPGAEIANNIRELAERSSAIETQLEKYPVGSIIASILNPAQFARTAGDPADFNILRSKWTIADGKMVSGTKFAALTNNKPVPNLRGMFLRGINLNRDDGRQDPDGEREPGTYQSDAFKEHFHNMDAANDRGTANSFREGAIQNNQYRTHPAGGNETRPRNVAVYYYIRIN